MDTQKDHDYIGIFSARRIAMELQQLPNLFGDTLAEHMRRRKVTNEMLAEALGISRRTITNLRNTATPALTFREVTAICICLHLEPELSEDLIAKAGIRPLPTAEQIVYRIVLRDMYRSGIDECNQALLEVGFEPLTRE